ncbi:flagellar export chaperone FlgN [Ruicaihuangia caeni]|uniref:Flagellar export chaperone FlgN n=1 Tax=Ruicaihuangia caeni TaxID=3042517 RepID=A0AAW6T256_9MICO|nr:flagellar export chaperone FlgN [Klugiella sp. YN-L-19]MDI2097867.1 flagellar export chaperone FlgN [Klugiella sp. YN-L-19]
MGSNELSAVLWRERELLETVLFKLETQRLLLTAGESRWLPLATRELEHVLEKLRGAGLGRAVEASAVAEAWGAPEQATLRELIQHAPTPAWREILTSHFDALSQLTSEVAALRDGNTRLLETASRAARETLDGIGRDAGTYSADGKPQRDEGSSRLLDTSL